MKIVFKVCCAADDAQNNTTMKSSTTTTTTISGPYRPLTGPTTTPSTTQFIPRTEATSTKKPTKKIGNYTRVYFKFDLNILEISAEYDKHPNEVVKNEELTYSSGVWLSTGPPSFIVLIACIAVIRWR